MSGTGFGWSALPSRRVVIGSLLGALASGSLLGLVIGIIAPSTPSSTVSDASARSTSSPTSSARASTAAGASPTRTKLKPIKTVTLSAMPAPNDFVQQPWNDPTMILGTLQSIDQNDPNNILIYLTKATLLTGGQARQFYQSQGQEPKATAVVPDGGAQPQQFVLANDAALWGQFVLGDGQNQNLHRFANVGEFLGVANGVLAQDRHPAVWVKQGADPQGRVIYLAEQYPA